MEILAPTIKKWHKILPFKYNFHKSENVKYNTGAIDFLTGSVWGRFGMKPQPNAVINYLEARNVNETYLQGLEKPIRILVGGNSVGSDVWLGLNLKKYYQNIGLEDKVRVDTFLYNRNKKKIKINIDNHNHYNLSTLEELSDLIKNNKYLVDFVDFDGTLVDFCLGKSSKVKLKSRIMLPKVKSETLNKISKVLAFGVRMSFLQTIYLGDTFYSGLKMKSRFSWPEKENNLKVFLESVSNLKTQLVISSFSNLGGVINAINDSKANVKLNKPVYY
jgi:hypothetical protein